MSIRDLSKTLKYFANANVLSIYIYISTLIITIIILLLLLLKWSQDNYSDFPPGKFIQTIMNFFAFRYFACRILKTNEQTKHLDLHVCHANKLFLLISRLDLFSPLSLIADSIIRSVSINIFIPIFFWRGSNCNTVCPNQTWHDSKYFLFMRNISQLLRGLEPMNSCMRGGRTTMRPSGVFRNTMQNTAVIKFGNDYVLYSMLKVSNVS